MKWWSRRKGLLAETAKKSVPAGLFVKCPACGENQVERDLDDNLRVCPTCNHHLRMSTRDRLALVCDENSFTECDADLISADPLEFRVDGKKYKDSIRSATRKSGAADAYLSGSATIDGHKVELGFFVFEFMGGSMGSVVGEKIARQFERALERRRPAVVFSASGGARMQEGVLSLMQMAKTSAARARLQQEGIPFVSVLLHPTTGGVAASFAMLGDIILTEPNALIGFAGPRVIEQTIRQQLPDGFQSAEFLLEHGIIDAIVERRQLKSALGRSLAWFRGGGNGVSA